MISNGWRGGGGDHDASNDGAVMHDHCSQEKVMNICLFAMYRSMTLEISRSEVSGCIYVHDKMVVASF